MTPPGAAGAARVAIVGAGVAGLSAARHLAEAGIDALVLEASDAPGGRARNARAAGHVFSSADTHLVALLEAAGRLGALRALDPPGWLLAHDGRLRSIDPTRGPLGFAAMPGVGWLEALRLVRLGRLWQRFAHSLDPRAPERAAALDDRSILEFAELYFGSGVAHRALGPLSVSGTQLAPEEASRLVFLLRRDALVTGRPSVLDVPAAAADADPWESVARRLVAPDRVRLGARVERVSARPDGGFTIEVQHSAGGDEELTSEALILAVPAPEAVRLTHPLLTTAERDALGAIRYRDALTLSAPLEPLPGAARAVLPEANADAIEAMTITREPGRGGGRLVAVTRPGYAGAHWQTPDGSIRKDLTERLARLDPRLAVPSDPGVCRVHRFPQALPEFRVGAFRRLARLRRVERSRAAEGRRLYFAGDHLAGPWLENAAASGRRAAHDVGVALGAISPDRRR